MKGIRILLAFLLITCSSLAFGQKTVSNASYYLLRVPDSLNETTEAGNDSERTFFDNVSGVVLLVTVREGLFDNPDRYMNCSRKDLERELKSFQDDSTLRLISCGKSKYYPDNAVVLHFETKMLPEGFNSCMIYFIHYKNKEMQFSFMYDKLEENAGVAYVDKVMQTLKLP